MKISELEGAIEAILFATGDLIPLSKIAESIEQDEGTTKALISVLMDRYESENRGFYIIQINNSYQMCTNPVYYQSVQNLLKSPQKKVLSQTLLETLAIIAYKQPITKLQIEEIRGVSADHAVNKLVEFNLVMEKGRLDVPGRPILFGTSNEFLKYFGFKNLDMLPDLPDNLDELKAEAENEIHQNF